MTAGWSNFYYLIGSAAAGLIGLLFVVVSFASGRNRQQTLRGIGLYLTPTILHFAAVFATSAVTQAPDLTADETAALVIIIALAGVACCLRSALGILRSPPGMGPPHWSDFWLYAGAPAGLYVTLGVAGLGLTTQWVWSPKVMAGALLILLLLAIRDAWDTVTWIAAAPND